MFQIQFVTSWTLSMRILLKNLHWHTAAASNLSNSAGRCQQGRGSGFVCMPACHFQKCSFTHVSAHASNTSTARFLMSLMGLRLLAYSTDQGNSNSILQSAQVSVCFMSSYPDEIQATICWSAMSSMSGLNFTHGCSSDFYFHQMMAEKGQDQPMWLISLHLF